MVGAVGWFILVQTWVISPVVVVQFDGNSHGVRRSASASSVGA